MIVQTLGEVPDELRVTAEQDERLAEQARRVGPASVVRLLDLVAVALRAMKDGADPRTQLELALIKGARPEHDPSLRALMARLERLEGRPARGAGAPAAPAPRRRRRDRAARAARPPPPAPSPPPPAPEPPAAAPRRTRRPRSSPRRPSRRRPGRSPRSPSSSRTARSSEPEVRVGVELDLPGVAELWPAVLADVQERSPMLHALIENARPSALDGGELTLSWAESAAFYKRKAEDPACREQIADGDPHRHRQLAAARLRARRRATRRTGAHDVPPLSDDELIDAFMREFDAEELPAEEES